MIYFEKSIKVKEVIYQKCDLTNILITEEKKRNYRTIIYDNYLLIFLEMNNNLEHSQNTYFDYLATSKTCNYSSKDCDFHDASYIIDFMNLVGFKSFGEVYGIAMPDPNLN